MQPMRAAVALVALLAGCASSPRFHVNGVRVDDSLVATRGPSSGLASKKFKPELCNGIDLTPEQNTLDQNALIDFLKAHGVRIASQRARGDLFYLDVEGVASDMPVRLRVAILRSPDEAALELHQALQKHDSHTWGVHRGNLAVLGATAASDDDAAAFVIGTKLACWGVFTVGGDGPDSVVVPGAYFEP